MKFQVMGLQAVSFPDKETGKIVQGTSLHCVAMEEIHTDRFDGRKVDKFFLWKDRFPVVKILPGDMIDIYFNRAGKVDSWAPAS